MVTAGGSPSLVSRRALLQSLPAAALSVNLVLKQGLADTPKQPATQFPKEPRARLSVTSYPFRAFINSPTNPERNSQFPGMEMKEFPAFVAEKFAVFNINPLVNHFSSTSPAYIGEFRSALEKAHSHIVDLGLPGRRFYAADASTREAAVEYGQKCVDIAVQVGSPSVRQHIAGHNGEKPDVSVAAGSLGALAEYGEKHNVVINLENDSPVPEDPFFLVAIIEKVNSPYLRALPDFGNSLLGHDNDFNRKAVAAMLKHAYNMCHVKDAVQEDNGKLSKVDLDSGFQLAKDSGYKGYFSMEFETRAGDPITGTKRLVEETLQHLS